MVTSVAFVSTFLLRVNYVGIGRFTLAVYSDVKMGHKKAVIERERVAVYNELLSLTNAKLCYKQVMMLESNQKMIEKEGDMWLSAEMTAESLNEAYKAMIFSVNYFSDAWKDIASSTARITQYVDKIEEKNPGLMDDLFGRKIDRLGGN